MGLLKGKRLYTKNRVSLRAVLCLLVMVSMTMEPAFLAAASAKTISEEQLPSLHAALVLKIAMFVNWPEKAPDCQGEKFVLTVAGDDVVFDAFEKLSDKKIQGKELLLLHNKELEIIRPGCILFISSRHSSNENTQQTFDSLPPGVLTISDDPNFNANGGIIKLSIENGRPRFTINLNAATATGIKFSSKLLKIATIYEEGTL